MIASVDFRLIFMSFFFVGCRRTAALSTRNGVARTTFRLANSWAETRRSTCRSVAFHNLSQLSVFRRTLSKKFYLSAVDEDEEATIESGKTVESEWNITGLKKETQRLVLRCHKKIGKAHQRLQNAKAEVDQLTKDSSASLRDLENCPDVDSLEWELQELQSRLGQLQTLEEHLKSIKKKSAILPEDMAKLAIDLGVNDEPPKQDRGPGKGKGPRKMESNRKPYRRYYSFQNIEIRVGKQAEDNDELTLSPEHRDNDDWWMHASGCPGSHVVIRCRDDQVPEEVVLDAAALAARQSKCSGSVIKVSMTRCRDIKKPMGAKAGLVQLTGKVRTVTVNMKDAQARLNRLDTTVLVN